MPHPVTQSDILGALESNAATIARLFSDLPDARLFIGDSDRWGPAHHLVHLTRTSLAIQRGLRSGTLPPCAAKRLRTYAEVRDAATGSLASTPKDRLLEMGRVVALEPGATREDLVRAFTSASADLRAAAAAWDERDLDRYAMRHPLIGELSVREMLFFCIVHERHHERRVRVILEADTARDSASP